MRKASRKKKVRSPRIPNVQNASVYVLHRLSTTLSKNQLIKALFPLWKFGWIENARTLAKQTSGSYEILQDFLSRDCADRYLDNLQRHQIEHVPEPFAKTGFRPLGQVLPEANEVLVTMLAEDSDVALSMALSTAQRMETKPKGDYIIPDLSPEEYAAVLKLRQKLSN